MRTSTMINTLKSESFFEKLTLLVLTAGLSGFLIPIITANIEHNRLREQKLFEAELARQAKIIDSQVKLLENLADLLWEYQLAAIDVPFNHQFGTNKELYSAASKKYDQSAGALLGKIRAEISKAMRLTSPNTYQGLKDLYYKDLLGLDLRLRRLMDGSANDWSAVNQYAVYDLSKTVDAVLNDLANELQLKPNSAPPAGARNR